MEKEVVNCINKILVTGIDVREALRSVHCQLKKVLESERMIVILLGEENKGFRYFDFENGKSEKEWVLDVIPSEETSWKKVFETGLPVVVPEISKDDSWIYRKLFQGGMKSSLFFPLIYEGKVIGTLNFGSKRPSHFSEDHIHFLERVAEGLSIFLYNATRYEETKRRLDEITILHDMTRISISSLSLDQVLTEIMKSLHRFFKWEALGLLLMDENTKRLLPHPSSIGFPIEEKGHLESLVGDGLLEGLAERESPFIVDVKRDPIHPKNGRRGCSEMLYIPLKTGDKLVGVMVAQGKMAGAFSNEDFRVMGLVGEHLATIIENSRSEERYRAVVESALDGVLVMGEDYRLSYVNESLVDLLGYSKEELIGSDFRSYMDEKGRKFIVDWLFHIQRGDKMPTSYELNLPRKDGEVRNVEISLTLIKDPMGDVSAIAFLKDITEKRKMEEQMLQVEKLRAVGEMASGVAHDFNNALAIIVGNAQLLLYTAKDEELRGALKTIEKVAKNGAQTVRRLMEFSGRKVVHIEYSKMDLNALIRDTVEITKPKWKDDAQGKGIYIEVVLNLGEIPLLARTLSEMREMMASFIFNAVEAMPEGGRLEILTSCLREKVSIRISDTGIGMTEEVRKRVFDPFFTTKPFSNTGLGLSMSYGIIKRLGGEIEVESEVGKGTTFHILLPIDEERKEEEKATHDVKREGEARILVIDDEEHVREILSKILTRAKYQVVVAENGERGIELFRKGKFDMVLTDLGMPEMSGWEVCRAIKKINPHLPVGMITGWGAGIDRPQMEENRLDFVISKPFDSEEVLNQIAEKVSSK